MAKTAAKSNNDANLGFECDLWRPAARLAAELRAQTAGSAKLYKLIWANLQEIGYGKA